MFHIRPPGHNAKQIGVIGIIDYSAVMELVNVARKIALPKFVGHDYILRELGGEPSVKF